MRIGLHRLKRWITSNLAVERVWNRLLVFRSMPHSSKFGKYAVMTRTCFSSTSVANNTWKIFLIPGIYKIYCKREQSALIEPSPRPSPLGREIKKTQIMPVRSIARHVFVVWIFFNYFKEINRFKNIFSRNESTFHPNINMIIQIISKIPVRWIALSGRIVRPQKTLTIEMNQM